MAVAPTNSSIPLGKDVAHIPQADPRLIYKAGEEPRLMHNIDAPGWLANGWSYDKPSETVEEIETKPVTVAPANVDNKETTRKPRRTAIES